MSDKIFEAKVAVYDEHGFLVVYFLNDDGEPSVTLANDEGPDTAMKLNVEQAKLFAIAMGSRAKRILKGEAKAHNDAIREAGGEP